MRKCLFLMVIFFFASGCMVVFQKGRRSDVEKIRALKERLTKLEEELSELKHTKGVLEQRLAQEIKNKQVRVSMENKGLVITFVAEVLFDSGKAELRKDSLPILDKVVRVLKEEVPHHNIGIEGHTDNQPIKYSKWKSNWELSAHRALSVLHYLESKGISPKRLSARGYGEYHPIASNDTPEGRQLNRRVEIVILPQEVKRVRKVPLRKMRKQREEKIYKEELK
ncbi:MAG: hypothetical protein B6D56_01025 [Candidatus Omnitrophica bacterium 4484_70.1]|nr:MAG: hypothetical protein B6D56_01025 [Candidatus Omnitrophica bacterium 4484_70.1]